MYTDTIESYTFRLTYNVMDTQTYETVFVKLPKYIQAIVHLFTLVKDYHSLYKNTMRYLGLLEEQYLGSVL